MTHVFSISSAVFLAIVSLLHVYWALGGKWGTDSVIPTTANHSRRTFSPRRGGTIIVACLLFCAFYILLAQSGYLSPIIAPFLIRWGCMLCAAVFILRAVGDFNYIGFFKKVKNTKFARQDTVLFSPLCLWLGISFLLALF
ncbi:DUF3995 domain-containing protein [Brevibacillus fortis]|uniref:DUF3995 domain-containing protein n=1 Tax=Brevibacillus fortis TaxID=2126352 RepID=UPI002E2034B3|nr:DUF3995 domain-containing protein [Brevibacillus fortis]